MSGSVESRADLLLGGRRGRAMLADLTGLDSLVLLAADGKPPPAGVTFLESSSSGLSARLRGCFARVALTVTREPGRSG
jgi:hypothetical protein